jgi:hypothetical protein
MNRHDRRSQSVAIAKLNRLFAGERGASMCLHAFFESAERAILCARKKGHVGEHCAEGRRWSVVKEDPR